MASLPLIWTTLCGAGLCVVLVVLAHLLNPEIDARLRMLSEQALGRRGWVMNAAFLVWAATNVALSAALWDVGPRWALVALAVVSLGLVGGAFVPADPIAAPAEAMTVPGRWHTICGALFILGLPVVTVLFAIAMAGTRLGPWALAMTVPVWVSLVAFIVLTARWQRAGRQMGVDAPIGIPNRVFCAVYLGWTVVMALAAL